MTHIKLFITSNQEVGYVMGTKSSDTGLTNHGKNKYKKRFIFQKK